MARRRPQRLLWLGLVLIVAAMAVGAAEVGRNLTLLERAVGGFVVQSGARRLARAVAESEWSLGLLALGLACLGLGATRMGRPRRRRAARRTRRPRSRRPPRAAR